jgi:hypothetical protein
MAGTEDGQLIFKSSQMVVKASDDYFVVAN